MSFPYLVTISQVILNKIQLFFIQKKFGQSIPDNSLLSFTDFPQIT